MGRRTAYWAVCDSPVQTSWNPSLELLLQSGSNKRIGAMVNATSRRNIHGLALLWLTQNCSRDKEGGGPHRQPQACAKDHEAVRPGKQSAGAQHIKTASPTCQIPLFVKRNDLASSPRGVEHRYHLHSTASGVWWSPKTRQVTKLYC